MPFIYELASKKMVETGPPLAAPALENARARAASGEDPDVIAADLGGVIVGPPETRRRIVVSRDHLEALLVLAHPTEPARERAWKELIDG